MRQPIRSNDPCWCGSGRKYKRCHQAERNRVRPGHGFAASPASPRTYRGPITQSSGRPVRTDEPMVKTTEIIERMRTAGRIAAEVLQVTGCGTRARDHDRRA